MTFGDPADSNSIAVMTDAANLATHTLVILIVFFPQKVAFLA
jgi:hypothetical protein